jgi:hypothetical protein
MSLEMSTCSTIQGRGRGFLYHEFVSRREGDRGDFVGKGTHMRPTDRSPFITFSHNLKEEKKIEKIGDEKNIPVRCTAVCKKISHW